MRKLLASMTVILLAFMMITTAVFAADESYEAYIGDTGYETLAEAVTVANSATENVTIKLDSDVTISSSQIISNIKAAVTLDLNGHSITGTLVANGYDTYAFQVKSGAVFTITDNAGGSGYISVSYQSTYSGGSTGSNGILNYGTLNVAGGTIQASNYAVWNDTGTVNVTGGTISCTNTTTGTGSYCIESEGGTINVSGGNIVAQGGNYSCGIQLIMGRGDCTVNVSGGTISGGNYGVWCTSTSIMTNLTVSGGSITGGNGCGVEIYRGNITITGGEISSSSGTGLRIRGGSFSMSDGTISGSQSAWGLYLFNQYLDVNADITGGDISGAIGVMAAEVSSFDNDITLTIGNSQGGPTITGSTSYRGLSVSGEPDITVANATIYSGQVASDYLADGVTQITFDGILYYINTSESLAQQIEALVSGAVAGSTVEVTVTDGDLELNIDSSAADVNITSESSGTVTVNGETVTGELTLHNYDYDNIVWTWNNDNTATATVTCSNCGDTRTVDATVTSRNVLGVVTRIATAEFDGVSYSSDPITSGTSLLIIGALTQTESEETASEEVTTEETVEIDEPIEDTNTEPEEDSEELEVSETETNPTTGAALMLLPMAVALAGAVVAKRKRI